MEGTVRGQAGSAWEWVRTLSVGGGCEPFELVGAMDSCDSRTCHVHSKSFRVISMVKGMYF